MRRRAALFLLISAILGGYGPDAVHAHAGPRVTYPAEGATLGDSPAVVKLAFSEKPEPSLSTIRVLDTRGIAYHVGRPTAAPGDPLSLSVQIRPLDRGIYIVEWRIVSAVDGHATSGAYAFGVRMAPTAGAASSTTATVSRLEMLSRWVLLLGLVVLLGAATASAARFGGTSDLAVATAGWIGAVLGLALLTLSQRQTAGAPLAALLTTSIGRGLIWRGAAIGAAGAAVLIASSARHRRGALIAAGLATMAAMAAHVAAGHAAATAGGLPPAAGIAAQWAHFAGAGVWLGGLCALLAGARGAPDADTAAAVRRFSRLAGGGLLVVLATGVVRTVAELTAAADLVATGYGRAIAVKIGLIAVIAALGAMNRWHSVPLAATDLRPLRRAGRIEILLAAGALAAAAALGTLAPPSSALVLPGLDQSAVDYGTTIRLRLTAPSDQPGPNRFVVRAVDYDSRQPVRADRVTLIFTPLDDPGVAPTSLELTPGPGNSYAGSGANLAFAGRWRVTARIVRAGSSVDVPVDIDAREPSQPVSTEHLPGVPPTYTVQVRGIGLVRFAPDPERAGHSKLYVTCWDLFGEDRSIDGIIVTALDATGRAHALPVQRVDRNHFIADIELRSGVNAIAAVARGSEGTRIRATLDLRID